MRHMPQKRRKIYVLISQANPTFFCWGRKWGELGRKREEALKAQETNGSVVKAKTFFLAKTGKDTR